MKNESNDKVAKVRSNFRSVWSTESEQESAFEKWYAWILVFAWCGLIVVFSIYNREFLIVFLLTTLILFALRFVAQFFDRSRR